MGFRIACTVTVFALVSASISDAQAGDGADEDGAALVENSAVGLSYTTGFYGGAWMDILRGTINLPGGLALEPTLASIEDPDFDVWSLHEYLGLRWSTRFQEGGYRFYFTVAGGIMHGLIGRSTTKKAPQWHALWYGGIEFLAGKRGTLSLEVGGGRAPNVVDRDQLSNQNWYLAIGGHFWAG